MSFKRFVYVRVKKTKKGYQLIATRGESKPICANNVLVSARRWLDARFKAEAIIRQILETEPDLLEIEQ